MSARFAFTLCKGVNFVLEFNRAFLAVARNDPLYVYPYGVVGSAQTKGGRATIFPSTRCKRSWIGGINPKQAKRHLLTES